jgi:hypothetical protein
MEFTGDLCANASKSENSHPQCCERSTDEEICVAAVVRIWAVGGKWYQPTKFWRDLPQIDSSRRPVRPQFD